MVKDYGKPGRREAPGFRHVGSLMDYATLRACVARNHADTLIAAAFRKALGVKPGRVDRDRYEGWFGCFLNRERFNL